MRYASGDNLAIARYTLAVDRRFHRDGEATADFINCVTFWTCCGVCRENICDREPKIAVSGRIQTGSYTNRDGHKVYTTEVVVDEQEFAEGKNAGSGSSHPQPAPETDPDGFMNIPEGIEEEMTVLTKKEEKWTTKKQG